MSKRHCLTFQELRDEDARRGVAGETQICGDKFTLIERHM